MYCMKAGYEKELVPRDATMSFCLLKALKNDLSRVQKK